MDPVDPVKAAYTSLMSALRLLDEPTEANLDQVHSHIADVLDQLVGNCIKECRLVAFGTTVADYRSDLWLEGKEGEGK